MKAVLVLVALYVVTFLVAIQGATPNQAQAAQNNASTQSQAKALDPAKETDIRSLMELVGARDQVQDNVSSSTEQYREKLLATVPNNEKGQAFISAFAAGYEKKFDADRVTEQIVAIY